MFSLFYVCTSCEIGCKSIKLSTNKQTHNLHQVYALKSKTDTYKQGDTSFSHYDTGQLILDHVRYSTFPLSNTVQTLDPDFRVVNMIVVYQ